MVWAPFRSFSQQPAVLRCRVRDSILGFSGVWRPIWRAGAGELPAPVSSLRSRLSSQEAVGVGRLLLVVGWTGRGSEEGIGKLRLGAPLPGDPHLGSVSILHWWNLRSSLCASQTWTTFPSCGVVQPILATSRKYWVCAQGLETPCRH